MPNGKNQATTSSNSTAMTIDSYKERLQLLNQTPYREYFSAFMAALCQAKQVADIVTSGKIDLADNKSQQILSYAVTIAADFGGQFVPTGTIAKLIKGVAGYFIEKHRKKGHAKVAETTSNPFHFVLLAQALIDCMLFYFDPSWCEGLNAKLAAKQGEKDAKLLAKGIKGSKVAFTEDQDLAIRLGACLGYLIKKKVIETDVTHLNWVEGKYEQILIMAAAQTLRLPPDQFTKIEELAKAYEEKFTKLEQEIEQITQKAEWQQKSEEEQCRAIEALVKAEAAKNQEQGRFFAVRSAVANVPGTNAERYLDAVDYAPSRRDDLAEALKNAKPGDQYHQDGAVANAQGSTAVVVSQNPSQAQADFRARFFSNQSSSSSSSSSSSYTPGNQGKK